MEQLSNPIKGASLKDNIMKKLFYLLLILFVVIISFACKERSQKVDPNSVAENKEIEKRLEEVKKKEKDSSSILYLHIL